MRNQGWPRSRSLVNWKALIMFRMEYQARGANVGLICFDAVFAKPANVSLRLHEKYITSPAALLQVYVNLKEPRSSGVRSHPSLRVTPCHEYCVCTCAYVYFFFFGCVCACVSVCLELASPYTVYCNCYCECVCVCLCRVQPPFPSGQDPAPVLKCTQFHPRRASVLG